MFLVKRLVEFPNLPFGSYELQRLIDPPSELERLRKGVPEPVKRFDWSKIAEQYSALYRNRVDGCSNISNSPNFSLTG